MTSVKRSGAEEEEARSHDDSDESDSECVKRRASSHRTNKLKYSSDDDASEAPSESSSPVSSSDEPSSDSDDEDDSHSDDSDSDYSFMKTKKRRRKKPARKATSALKSQRRSTAAKPINYCEDSEHATDTDDIIYTYEDEATQRASADSETIERVIKQRLGRPGAVGSKTAVYNVDEHGDPNASPAPHEPAEPHYLIKWLGWSHLHNTWESRDSLLAQKVKGIKKLENFLRKEAAVRDPAALSPEDIDYMECQSEMMDNLLQTHTMVERVISDRANDYLCKWHGLPYSECTWEDGELIRKRFGPLVREYERRRAATTLPPLNVKSQRALRLRPKFVPLKHKPEYLGEGAELRDYQLDGLNWLANSWCRQNGVILADEMGLGKTVQAISFMSYVFNEHSVYGPFLIVIPLSTIQGWQREFQKWSPQINLVIYLGDSQSRAIIQKYEWAADNKKIKCNAVLTTYEILLKDKAFFSSVSWAALVVDEAHRLKNEDSLLYRTLIKFDTNHRLLVTGTPLQNSLKELWSLLHFIMPDKFAQWDEFDAKYSSVLQDGLRFQDLHKELQPYLLRRVKKDVEKSLPGKVEQILRVEMTKQQKQFYKLILTKNYKELLKGSKGNVSTFLNIMMELKKCSNHTYLIRRDEDKAAESQLDNLVRGSGKLFLLDKLLRRLKETGHRVLIFSQMVRMLDLIAEYLQYRRFSFQRLDGSIKGEIRRQALDHFNKPDSDDFCFLLSTRAGGLGINLSTADTVIIYDSDWNPQNDLQAQARAHRIGQKNQVNIYRLVSKNSIEEDIVERAKQKMVLDHLVIQRMDTTGRTVLNSRAQTNSNPFTKDEINSILKFGAEELFKEDTESKSDDKDYDIDEILKRAETREEASEPRAGDELLSQFKVATFSTTEDDKSWTDIIPESERHQIDADEQTEKLQLFSETRRPRTQKPKRNARSDDDDDDHEYANDSADSSDSEARLKTAKKTKIKSQSVFAGLNSSEIRRFVRSYRKYPCPLERIDTVAQDAQLEEKSQACLIEFAHKMRELCVQAIEHSKDKKDVTISKKGPCVDINGAKINAQQVLDAEKYFEPLGHYSSRFDQFQFKTKLKQTYWDCEWGDEDDRALLKGVLEHGYGNWESIKADRALGLSDKILVTMSNVKKSDKSDVTLRLSDKNVDTMSAVKKSDKTDAALRLSDKNLVTMSSVKKSDKSDGAKLKPQSKHLRTRIDYLMKVLLNQTNTDKYGKNWKEILNGTAAKRKNKNDSEHSAAEHSDASDKCVKKRRANSADDCNNENSGDHVTRETEETGQPSAKRHAKKTGAKVDKKEAKMDKSKIVLSEKIFEECKNILRPVKRALKSLNQLDSVKDFEEIKRHLLQIGDKINDHLTIYSDPEKINLWRNYLWAFVSKFTVKWNWEKLKNLYKKFCNSRDHDLYTQSQLATNGPYGSSSYSATNHTNNNYHHHNHHHHYPQSKYYSKKNHGYHGNQYGNHYGNQHMYQQQWSSADKSHSSRSRDQDMDSDVYRSKSYSSLSGHNSQAGLLGASPVFNRQFNRPHSPSSSPYSRRLSSSSSSHRTGDSCKKLKESRETSPSRDNHTQHSHQHQNHHHN